MIYKQKNNLMFFDQCGIVFIAVETNKHTKRRKKYMANKKSKKTPAVATTNQFRIPVTRIIQTDVVVDAEILSHALDKVADLIESGKVDWSKAIAVDGSDEIDELTAEERYPTE